jgi:hypothetical protein
MFWVVSENLSDELLLLVSVGYECAGVSLFLMHLADFVVVWYSLAQSWIFLGQSYAMATSTNMTWASRL